MPLHRPDCWILAVCLLVASHYCRASASAAPAEPPNVVIILADDLGYGDLHCYQPSSVIPTPHLDALAAGGMRFTDAHTPSSVCTPTRYTLLTGRYCWRTRLKSSVLDGFSPPLIEDDRPTIASMLRNGGYATACIGKWHLGMQWTRTDGAPETVDRAEEGFRSGENIDFSVPVSAGPLTCGFDSYFGISASLDMPPYCWIDGNRCSPPPDSSVPRAQNTIFLNQAAGAAHSDFRINEVLPTLKLRAVNWINQQTAERPFFLYLPLNSPHLPVAPSAAFVGKSGAGTYGDFVMETDDVVGGVVAALREAQLLENTMLIFSTDNGGLWHAWEPQEADDVAHYKPSARGLYNLEHGHRSNAHLRGTKADIWEGGHHVPLIVHWPRRVAAGTTSDALVELTDVYATLAEACGAVVQEGAAEDSFGFLPVLVSDDSLATTARPFAVHHSINGTFAIRQGPWKMVGMRGSAGFSRPKAVQPRPGEPVGQLYHMQDDPAETKNLYDEQPQVVMRLAALLKQAQERGLVELALGDAPPRNTAIPQSSEVSAGRPWRRHTIDNRSRGADGVRLADTNGDGLSDIVTGWEEGGVIRVYQNPGPRQAAQPWPSVEVGRVKSPEDAVLVDLDGDGALDVVSSCEGRIRTMYIHWAPAAEQAYLQESEWTTTAIEATAGKSAWMFCLPMDVDGRHGIDLVVGSKQPGAMIGWLESPADPRETAQWKLHTLRKSQWMMSLAPIDLDGDGDQDIVASDRKTSASRVLWLENPGTSGAAAGQTWAEHVIGARGEQVMFLDVVDVSGDGKPDVLAAAKERQVILLVQGDDARATWQRSTLAFGDEFGTAKAVRADDIDLDGQLDLAITCEEAKGPSSGVLWMRGSLDDTAAWQAHDIGGPEGVKYDLIELVDLDADGDLDLLTCEERDLLGVVWYENPTR